MPPRKPPTSDQELHEHFAEVLEDYRRSEREDRELPFNDETEEPPQPARVDYYGYDSAWHCLRCAQAHGMTREGARDAEGAHPVAVMSWTTSRTDSPLHCSTCGVFLKNDLTDHGVAELVSRLERFEHGKGTTETLNEWADHYRKDLEETVDLFLCAARTLAEVDIEGYEDEHEPHGLYDALLGCAQKGCDAYPEIRALRRAYRVIAAPDIAQSLRRWGAWDDEALLDHDENVNRAIWILACELSQAREDARNACLSL